MPIFPTTEVNVMQLSMNVMAGLNAYPTDFPSLDPVALGLLIATYNNAVGDAQTARAEAKAATAAKDAAFIALRDEVRKYLNLATVENPTKLDEIGWALPGPRTPLSPPDMAKNLTSTFQGDGEVSMKWDKPTSGGKVAAYILQSQSFSEGAWSNWQMVNFFYDNQATLTAQPTGVKINYRVIASNDAGQSNPSNTITVVL
ncbi:MAG: fibronectin type III domain-containing protein [Phycisphaerae bacterium]|nr:fibronectin type III domain-containing protein [Phycisphaerae bacterium]